MVGTSYWGYKEHQEKDAVCFMPKQLSRAFHDLTYQVDQLHDKSGARLR
ncbi:germination protein YpeB [Bacillus licheniformis]|nr:germination protein YpeB [Bacillus licheniformis]